VKAKRRDPTERVKREIRERQGDVCFLENCSEPIAVFEHWTPVAMGNADYPDCGLCKGHAAEKTKRDVANIAKVKRIRKREAGETKTKRKIQSPGFRKDVRKKMDGTVEKKR
jgi:hypothetical protein